LLVVRMALGGPPYTFLEARQLTKHSSQVLATHFGSCARI